MARKRKPKIKEKNLHGFKHFELLLPVLERLHHNGCQGDRAGNRILHVDPYAALILLYFFNPIVTSLRSIQQSSELKKVQRILGCSRASLGSLSEAARVFDADLLRRIIDELAPLLRDRVLTARGQGVAAHQSTSGSLPSEVRRRQVQASRARFFSVSVMLTDGSFPPTAFCRQEANSFPPLWRAKAFAGFSVK